MMDNSNCECSFSVAVLVIYFVTPLTSLFGGHPWNS
jgi:hypothetical protein